MGVKGCVLTFNTLLCEFIEKMPNQLVPYTVLIIKLNSCSLGNPSSLDIPTVKNLSLMVSKLKTFNKC